MEELSPESEKLQPENIKWAVRIRPISKQELERCPISSVYASNSNSIYHCRLERENKLIKFDFDYVFDENSSQSEVYNKSVSSIIHSAIDGYNGAIFWYGQSGSGRRHTMYGAKLVPMTST